MSLDSVPPLPAPLAVVVILGSVVTALYLARALARRHRRGDRREGRSLLRLMHGALRDETWGEPMKRAAMRADAGTFWTAVERLSLSPDRRGLARLADTFDTLDHVATERRRLRDDSPWRRELAARRLGLLPSKRTRHALRLALRRGPEAVSFAAGLALARGRDRAALRWILAHPEILARRSRRAWAGLLAAFGRRGLPEIAAAFERGMGPQPLELAAMDVLGQRRYRGARDRLEQHLTSGTLEQRVAAARALGQLQAVECSTSLLHALHDEDWPVRAQAARALGRVRATIAITALATRLTDPAYWVRHHAAYALGDLGYDGQQALRRVAQTSHDPYARDIAREVLEGGIHRSVA